MELDKASGKVWLDEFDRGDSAKQWIVTSGEGSIIAASARLTIHNPDDILVYRDVQLWQSLGIPIAYPICDLGRLVVDSRFRRLGIAQELNRLRIEEARRWGAKTIVVTASDGNVRLLEKSGFEKIGKTVEFKDRPGVIFHAMQLIL